MDIGEIRSKYRHILEEDFGTKTNKNLSAIDQSHDEENSQREWINIVKRSKEKRVLTEYNSNIQTKENQENGRKKTNVTKQKASSKPTSQQAFIQLKQKLAQSILNNSRKDAQLVQFQHLLLRKNQQIKLQQKSINQLKKVIQDKDSLIFEEKLKQQDLHKIIKQKDETIQQYRIQNQLLKKHIQHYAKQVQELNHKMNQQNKHCQKVQKQKEKVDSLKSKIQRLKDDVKRLQFLLSDNEVYVPLLVSLQGKHFLGKPNKEAKQLEYWYPDRLINGVEKFLKKQQVGYGNKVFAESLVKFIYCLMERSEKTGEKKGKDKYSSRIKQLERKKNQILTVFEVGKQCQSKYRSSRNSRLNASSLRKTTPLNGNSQIKSRDFSICLEKSLCLEKQTLHNSKHVTATNRDTNQTKKPFIIEGLEKSVRLNENHKKHVIMELIESFCKGVEKLFKLENKTLVQQKIGQLCEWLKESVDEIYHSTVNEDFYNQTGKWKTVGDC